MLTDTVPIHDPMSERPWAGNSPAMTGCVKFFGSRQLFTGDTTCSAEDLSLSPPPS